MSPRTIIHTTVSLDNAFTGFEIDIGLHYELLLSLHPDALLVGSTTAGSRRSWTSPGPRPRTSANARRCVPTTPARSGSSWTVGEP
ncbi:hypothetical protein [Methanofollis tationis]|uniref:hypothetical protein n=1 Tax=Methanofollis tationis TaxID=81417 RepID=UPI001FED15D7|nr:hypothetical protein [Methanofollis tationis]